jgi:transposase
MSKRLWKKQLKALELELASLRQENAQLRQENRRLRSRVKELEDRLGQNSQNSSQPPSSDPPSAPPQAHRIPSGRKPGGQPGHPRHERELFPPERVDKTIAVKPERCAGCGSRLSGEDLHPQRHQVIDLPPIKPVVAEYQIHALACARCHQVTVADLPQGVPLGAYSSRVISLVSLLTSLYHLGRRPASEAMKDLFGITMSVGSVAKCEQITSASLKDPVAEAHAYVQKQPVKNADETSWYEGPQREKVWLWTAFTDQVTVFLIRASRGTEVAKELLGEVFGVLGTDRWGAYKWWPLLWRQLCWAHMKRHFKAFAEFGGQAGRVGRALLEEEKLLFTWWYRVRDGTLAHSSFQTYVVPLRQRVKALLEEGARCGHPKTMSMCRDILTVEPALWTFVRLPGVEPTNNAAERVIRCLVIWRKICFGTHSEAGSRFVERIMTVVCTLKQQERNVVDYVTASVEASMRGHCPQSILPTTIRK